MKIGANGDEMLEVWVCIARSPLRGRVIFQEQPCGAQQPTLLSIHVAVRENVDKTRETNGVEKAGRAPEAVLPSATPVNTGSSTLAAASTSSSGVAKPCSPCSAANRSAMWAGFSSLIQPVSTEFM